MSRTSTIQPFLCLSAVCLAKMVSAWAPAHLKLLTLRSNYNKCPPPTLYPDHHHSFRLMTTAYSGEVGDGKLGIENISYLPIHSELTSGIKVEVNAFESSEWPTGMDLMNLIIHEGKSWPFTDQFECMDSYRSYFLSHAAFVVRVSHDCVHPISGEKVRKGDFMGCFYIKPNYPGRCSHICNGGFITAPKFRRLGVAKIMGKAFCKIAKDLGYKSSYFNLVFKSNIASVKLWEGLGFKRVAVLEEAADLKGVEGLDTAYGYRFDLTKLDEYFKV